ncbi:MAG: AI-2E family transporter [Flavobacteriales bacterium]
MKQSIRVALALAGIFLLLFVAWYLRVVIVYVLISIVLSFIGRPIVNLLDKVQIGKYTIPNALSAILTLSLFIFIFSLLLKLIIPLIVAEAKMLSNIDINAVANNLEKPINNFKAWLNRYGITSNEDFSLIQQLQKRIADFIDFTKIPALFGTIISELSSIFISIFSILFMSFFFLNDLFNDSGKLYGTHG